MSERTYQTFSKIKGDKGFEIYDDNSNFLLKCFGPVVVGDDELVVE